MNKKAVELNFYQGSQALAKGAIAAGCKFYAAYPVIAAHEVSEYTSSMMQETGGIYQQMEDEKASLAACIGASRTGLKSMSATSSPGFSSLLENLGFAIATQTPLVLVNVQTLGPSMGQLTRAAQADIQQARWGANGDYQIIALSPYSVQEMYDLTIEAFNISEKLRVPVVILIDELLAHLRENAKLKPEPHVVDRDKRKGTFGTKQKIMVTGAVHDEEGLRKDSDPEAAQAFLEKLSSKILSKKDEITKFEKDSVDDAETVVVSCGFTARSASKAVKLARRKGIKLGLFRLITIWPFPDEAVMLLKKKKIIVAEMSKGQLAREVERCTGIKPHLLSKTNGLPIEPEEIVEFAEKISK